MRKTALRLLTIFSLVCLLMLPSAATAEAREHFRGGGRVAVVPSYSLYYPYWGWGWGWGWGPYWDYGPYYYESTGKIKIKDYNKFDEVYINGAYAGTVDKLKSIKLNPGRYTVEIKQQGKDILNRSVYVIAGQTVQIDVKG